MYEKHALMYVRMYVSYVLTSIFMQADMHEYVGMYTCMWVGTHALIYKCKYVCMHHIDMYACTYVWK